MKCRAEKIKGEGGLYDKDCNVVGYQIMIGLYEVTMCVIKCVNKSFTVTISDISISCYYNSVPFNHNLRACGEHVGHES